MFQVVFRVVREDDASHVIFVGHTSFVLVQGRDVKGSAHFAATTKVNSEMYRASLAANRGSIPQVDHLGREKSQRWHDARNWPRVLISEGMDFFKIEVVKVCRTDADLAMTLARAKKDHPRAASPSNPNPDYISR